MHFHAASDKKQPLHEITGVIMAEDGVGVSNDCIVDKNKSRCLSRTATKRRR